MVLAITKKYTMLFKCEWSASLYVVNWAFIGENLHFMYMWHQIVEKFIFENNFQI